MSEREQAGAAGDLVGAFGESYRTVVQSALEAQQRNVGLAQNWVESLTGLLQSQAETNQALTRAMESYVKVVDESLEAQARTNKALAESMESYKEVVEKVSNLQEKNTELTQGFFEKVTGELQSQVESNEAIARGMVEGSQQQMEAFQKMLTEATESYSNLMSAPFALYQKNLETFRKGGE
ncbi:MAG: hypothetical protein M3479_02500 [Actinomycetota bacterium]|jgi:uncharacterized protein YdiU (UPF0061 family)|nr:hypothetical protein [Rubrobacteraceae bacterium]MDQ3428800.1 hypothetical protein [Actinomycetota bacterium]